MIGETLTYCSWLVLISEGQKDKNRLAGGCLNKCLIQTAKL